MDLGQASRQNFTKGCLVFKYESHSLTGATGLNKAGFLHPRSSLIEKVPNKNLDDQNCSVRDNPVAVGLGSFGDSEKIYKDRLEQIICS